MKIYELLILIFLSSVSVYGSYYLLHVPKPPEETEAYDMDRGVWAYINPLRDYDSMLNRGLKHEKVVPPHVNSVREVQPGQLLDDHQLIPLPDFNMRRPTNDIKNEIVNVEDLNNAVKNFEMKHRFVSELKANGKRMEARYYIKIPGQNKELDDYDVLLSDEDIVLG